MIPAPRLDTRITLFATLVPLLLAGCASAKATFEVTVTNRAAHPVAVGLVKVGGGVEPAWAGPEHIAARAPQLGERRWGTLIRPGGTAVLGPQTGTFCQGSRAILRVYAGDHTMDEFNAFSLRDRFRADVDLLPGISYYVVENTERGIVVIQGDPREAPPPSNPQAQAR